jgi:hypothetical protein
MNLPHLPKGPVKRVTESVKDSIAPMVQAVKTAMIIACIAMALAVVALFRGR